MQKTLANGPFKSAYKQAVKLKGRKREEAFTELNERMDMYSVAEDFAAYYPKIYTKDMLKAIVNARNNIEAENILVALRKKQGEAMAW